MHHTGADEGRCPSTSSSIPSARRRLVSRRVRGGSRRRSGTMNDGTSSRLPVRRHIRRAERRVGGVAHDLLRDAQGDADFVPLRLDHGGAPRELDQIGSPTPDEEVLLGEVAHSDLRVTVLPFDVVRADVGLVLWTRTFVVVTPPALPATRRDTPRSAKTATPSRMALDCATGTAKWRCVGRIVDAMNVSLEAELPRVSEPALHTDSSSARKPAVDLIGDSGHRDHLAPWTRGI